MFIKTLQWLYIFNFRKLRVGQNIFCSTYHCFSEVIKGCLAETEKKKEKYCYLNKRNISNKWSLSTLRNHCCSVAKSYMTLCNPMDCSTPGSSVIHYLPVCSESCPLSWWWYLTISSLVSPSPFASSLPSIRVFSSELALPTRWPKYWSFSFSNYNEYSGLIVY